MRRHLTSWRGQVKVQVYFEQATTTSRINAETVFRLSRRRFITIPGGGGCSRPPSHLHAPCTRGTRRYVWLRRLRHLTSLPSCRLPPSQPFPRPPWLASPASLCLGSWIGTGTVSSKHRAGFANHARMYLVNACRAILQVRVLRSYTYTVVSLSFIARGDTALAAISEPVS